MYWLKLSSRTPFTLWHIHKYLPWNQPRFKYHLSTLTTTKVKTSMYTFNYFDNNRDSDANVYCNYIENITHTRLLNILYICFMNWVSWCWVVINELNKCMWCVKSMSLSRWQMGFNECQKIYKTTNFPIFFCSFQFGEVTILLGLFLNINLFIFY